MALTARVSSVRLASSASARCSSRPVCLAVSRVPARHVVVRAAEVPVEDSTAELQKQASDALKFVQTKWEETTDSEKPAAVAIIVASVVAQIAIGATVDAVNHIPLISSFLEFVGLAVTANYGWRYATDPEARAAVKETVDAFVASVTGDKA